MADTKHVGRITKTNKKCGVVYRVVPGDPDNCIVVMTESLDAADHDSFINLINSTTAQDSYELGEAMARSQLSDGSNMLARFHKTGRMQKVASNLVELVPNNNASINLAELNKIIAEQKGVTISDLALGGATPVVNKGVTNAADAYVEPNIESTTNDVLDDNAIAKNLRSQADAMFKEAQRLRNEAEELSPTKKIASVKKSSKKTAESA
jgi:hypothetical protein